LSVSRSYFTNKRVLITGASSGIGEALCREISNLGATLVMVARNQAKLTQLQAQLHRKSDLPDSSHEIFVTDITDAKELKQSLERICLEPVDILINNAGIACNDRFENLDEHVFREMIETNFLAQTAICRMVLPHMKKNAQGHIVNVASVAGVLGLAGYTAYGASKFALVGFTRALRNELSGTGIKTTLVMPSDVDTPQFQQEQQTRSSANQAIAGKGAKAITADQAARLICSAISKQKEEAIISPFSGRVPVWLCQWFPGISRKVMDSVTKKYN